MNSDDMIAVQQQRQYEDSVRARNNPPELPTYKHAGQLSPTVTAVGQYTAIGWTLCLMRRGEKGPHTPGWNKPGHGISNMQQLPGDYDGNIGLMHAYSGTVAVDIDDFDLAKVWLAERGIDLQQLLDADDAVQIRSGRKGSAKLIYRYQNGVPLRSRKITTNGKVILELRHANREGTTVQDALPPSVHPEGHTYQWAGKGHYSALPTVPDVILELWHKLETEAAFPTVPVRGTHNATPDEIEGALQFCDPDSPRTPWIHVGMALKLAMGDAGFPVWFEWSSKSPKFKPGEMARQWQSFDNSRENPVTLGTLFMLAKDGGWVRPEPDIEQLFKATSSGAMRKTPDEIMAELCPSVPPLNPELLPDLLANYAREISERIGCDVVVPALAALSAVSMAADKRSRLYVNTRFIEPPIIRVMVVGDPSDKKTPGSKPMFEVLRKLETEDRQRFEAEMLAWIGKEARYASAMKAFKEHSADPSNPENAQPPEVPGLPPKPTPLRTMMTDATSQKVATILVENERGIGLKLDESLNWLRKITDPRSGENVSFYTESYGGGFYPLDRQGGGTTPIPNCAVSIYMNVQPAALDECLPYMMIDGGHARFIYGFSGVERLTNGDIDDRPSWMSFEDEYEQMIRAVFAVPAKTFQLSPGAREAFRAWHNESNEYGIKLKKAMTGKLLEGFVGKLSGMSLRVALLFHLVENRHADEVDEKTMTRAIRFLREFAVPQVRYMDKVDFDQKLLHWLTNYILKHAHEERTSLSLLSRALRKNHSVGKNINEAEYDYRLRAGLRELALQGWVLPVAVKNAKTEHWLINPELKTFFAELIEQLKVEGGMMKFDK